MAPKGRVAQLVLCPQIQEWRSVFPVLRFHISTGATHSVNYFCIMHSHGLFTRDTNKGELRACVLGERLGERGGIKVTVKT